MKKIKFFGAPCQLTIMALFILSSLCCYKYETFTLDDSNDYVLVNKYETVSYHKYHEHTHYKVIARNKYGLFEFEMNPYFLITASVGRQFSLEEPFSVEELLSNAINKNTEENV